MPLSDYHTTSTAIKRKWTMAIRPLFFIFLTMLLTTVFAPGAFSRQPQTSPVINQQQQEQHYPNPSRAAMLSAVLPGMGQIYNGRIWKVPIIYAGFGAVIYAVNFNNQEYQFWRNAYIAKVDGNPNTIDLFPGIPDHNILRQMNFYRRNLEISYIAGAALYLLNILDASVDAHLMDFDVGEDLSMKIIPLMAPTFGQNINSVTGLKLTLRF